MSNHRYEVWAHACAWSSDVEVMVYRFEVDNVQSAAQAVVDVDAVTFKAYSLGAPPRPTFVVSRTSAQRLFDQLFAAGFRPNGGRDSEGVHAAQREHIEDLRKVLNAFVKENP